jgi:hypothetical protein
MQWNIKCERAGYREKYTKIEDNRSPIGEGETTIIKRERRFIPPTHFVTPSLLFLTYLFIHTLTHKHNQLTNSIH